MNIAIIGYGKMGRLIEQIALGRGHTIVSIIDPTDEQATSRKITPDSVTDADMVIDFTHPDVVVENIKSTAKLGKNMLVGTTGWYDRLDEVKEIVGDAGIGFIYAANFSVGVNLFFKIVEEASRLIDKLPEYDAFGYELHHNKKADSPSGTARNVAEIMLNNISRKHKINYDRADAQIKPEELHYASVRAGSIPGTHIAAFDSDADTIELKHTARSRNGFALGALIAAEWLKDKKGFFEMSDFIDEFFSKQ